MKNQPLKKAYDVLRSRLFCPSKKNIMLVYPRFEDIWPKQIRFSYFRTSLGGNKKLRLNSPIFPFFTNNIKYWQNLNKKYHFLPRFYYFCQYEQNSLMNFLFSSKERKYVNNSLYKKKYNKNEANFCFLNHLGT